MKRWHLEAGLLGATSGHVCWKLCAFLPAGSASATLLLILTAAAIWQERRDSPVKLRLLAVAKKAESQGTALGALALPWCFAALQMSASKNYNAHEPTFSEFALRASAASSALTMAYLMLTLPARKPLVGKNEDNSKHSEGSRKTGWLYTGPLTPSSVALFLLAAYSTSSPMLEGGLGSPKDLQNQRFSSASPRLEAAGIALNATTSAAGVHLLLTHLPRCFTIGEAMVVAEALTLLITDAIIVLASLGLASHSQTGSSLQTVLGERSQMQVFVELLLFAALCVTFVAVHLMWSIPGFGPPSSSWRESPSSKPISKRPGEASARNVTADGCALLEAAKLEANNEQMLTKRSATAWINDRRPDLKQQIRSEGNLKPWTQQQLMEHFSLETVMLGLLVISAVILAMKPAAWVLGFALSSTRRTCILGYWVAILALALPGMDRLSRRTRTPTIIVRKGYHILALVLFAPALILEPDLLSASLAIGCALLLVTEAVRIGGVPVIGPRIHDFMTSFIDERDSGLILVSHFSLLVGMAAPVWLSSPGSLSGHQNQTAAFSGIAILGVADSAASFFGRRMGRHRILGTQKTLEGTVGGTFCNVLLWAFLSYFVSGASFWQLVVASVLSCLLEASTTQLDNIFLPLHHFTLLA